MLILKQHSTPIFRSLCSFLAVLACLQSATVLAMPAQSVAPTKTTDQSKIIVKFKASADVDLTGNSFARNTGRGFQADRQINAVLDTNKVIRKQRLINQDRQTFERQRSQTVTPLAANEGDLHNYYLLTLGEGKKAKDVAEQLKAIPSVETAYAQPLPAPAPMAPSFVPQQTHLKPAPAGLTANPYVGGDTTLKKSYPGVFGDKVHVTDLEYSWNRQHEDLAILRVAGSDWKNGTPVNPFSDTHHGTAVAGIIGGTYNNGGVNGIVPKSPFHTINANNKESGYAPAAAIHLAATKMTAGDILLLEQQAWAPDHKGFAPLELYPDVYDAIKYATAKGVTVIEAAGNGRTDYWEGYDLSSAQFGTSFTTKPSSGAIIVGAGGSGCDNPITPALARNAYSNYGTRVDMHGIGDCVVTTGYGTLYNSGGVHALYDSTFGGTSSASAIIAGYAASVSSAYEQINGKTLSPSSVKAILLTGATPQNTSTNPGKIGPRPNMAHALKKTDLSRPTAPTTLTGKLAATNKISLAWKGSADNLGYVRYNIYRNGVFIKQVGATSYTDTTITTKTTFTYKIVAIDASKNASIASNSVTVTNK